MIFNTPYGSLTIEDLNSRGFMVKYFLKKGMKKVWSWLWMKVGRSGRSSGS